MALRKGCFYDIRFFVACFGFLILTDIMAGVMKNSSLTTIERRFNLPSTTTALLASSFSIGSLTTVLFASYLGARWHRPRAIFYGSALMVIGNFITILPQFFGNRYEYLDISSNVTSPKTSGITECSTSSESSAHDDKMVCEGIENPTNNLYVLLVIGMMVNGVGGSALQSLGMSYIDDFAHERNSPLYLGVTYAVGLIGPMMGYVVSSVVLKLWVDIGWVDISTINITPTHPSWVGAWWLGLFICTCGIVIALLPFYFFPKTMDKQKYSATSKGIKSNLNTKAEIDEHVEATKTEELENLAQETRKNTSVWSREKKKIAHTLKSMATNHLFHLVVFKMYLGHAALVGIANFFPKYLEVGFGASASKANLLTGVINIPCVMAGTLVGALAMKHFNLSTLGATKLIVAATVLATTCIAPMLFIGCETIDIAGITTPYIDRSTNTLPSVQSQCNENCDCSSGSYAPVCGSDGLSYVSPCHAGCSGAQYNGAGMKENFTDCSCIMANDDSASWARAERCELSNCGDLANVVLGLKSCGSFFAGLTATPLYVMMLRSVEPDQKSIAIGVHLVINRVLAWIPGPVVYGALIDSACLYWGKKPCSDRAYCKVYDNTAYRHRFYGLVVLCNVLSCFAATALYYTVRRRQRTETKNVNSQDTKQTGTVDEKERLTQREEHDYPAETTV